MRHVSFAQALVVLGCFVAIGLAHYTGPVEGTLVSAAVAFLLWMREPPGPMPPGAVKAVAGVCLGLFLGHAVGCGAATPPDPLVAAMDGAIVESCKTVGRAAHSYHAYDNCLREHGFRGDAGPDPVDAGADVEDAHADR